MTLVLIAGLSALNMNMILPALPELARHFGADYSVAALAVSAYLGLTGLLQLGIGPMSDRFGRRPVLLPSTGETRTFLADGDAVVLRGHCEREGRARIGFGECRGTVLPAARL